jgi:hypothetical protein
MFAANESKHYQEQSIVNSSGFPFGHDFQPSWMGANAEDNHQ